MSRPGGMPRPTGRNAGTETTETTEDDLTVTTTTTDSRPGTDMGETR